LTDAVAQAAYRPVEIGRGRGVGPSRDQPCLVRHEVGNGRRGVSVVEVRVVAARPAVAADGSVLVEQYYPQPVGLDLREVPDDAEQAHG